jgi:hypothetical protein
MSKPTPTIACWAVVHALEKGLSRLQSVKPEEITGALPKQLPFTRRDEP